MSGDNRQNHHKHSSSGGSRHHSRSATGSSPFGGGRDNPGTSQRLFGQKPDQGSLDRYREHQRTQAAASQAFYRKYPNNDSVPGDLRFGYVNEPVLDSQGRIMVDNGQIRTKQVPKPENRSTGRAMEYMEREHSMRKLGHWGGDRYWNPWQESQSREDAIDAQLQSRLTQLRQQQRYEERDEERAQARAPDASSSAGSYLSSDYYSSV